MEKAAVATVDVGAGLAFDEGFEVASARGVAAVADTLSAAAEGVARPRTVVRLRLAAPLVTAFTIGESRLDLVAESAEAVAGKGGVHSWLHGGRSSEALGEDDDRSFEGRLECLHSCEP